MQPGKEWIALVDGNNFYVSCERLFRPDLEGRMVGVLSNNDGCVVSRSAEIKPFVKMGMPFFLIDEEIKKQAVFLSSNYALYGDMSARVVETLRLFSNHIEIYSIDESFVFLPPLTESEAAQYGQAIRERVKQNTSIPVGVGISTTYTLSKFANMCAKKLPDYEGVCVITPGSDRARHLMKAFPVGELWGVGRKLAPRLEAIGIKTVWDLHETDPVIMRRQFSVVQEKMVHELRGVSCLDMTDPDMKHNIMTSRSFGSSTSSYNDLVEAVRMHATRGAEKLRKERGVARALMVLLNTNKHRKDLPQYFPRITRALPIPSNDSRIIIKTALEALKTAYRPKYKYMKAGVMLLDIGPENAPQTSLLDAMEAPERERGRKLMDALDSITSKYGAKSLTFGLTTHDAPWQMKRSLRTPAYLTDWKQLPVVKAE